MLSNDGDLLTLRRSWDVFQYHTWKCGKLCPRFDEIW